MDLGLIFLTGLTVGGTTCLAVQGGLLASVIASREKEDIKGGDFKKHSLWPTLVFLICKLAAYTVLGFILGAFGGAIALTDSLRTLMQLIAGGYMIAVALNLLNVHPIFRHVVIQPPKFLVRKVWTQSKSKDLFAPAFLGLMTIFVPCGTTIAMEALAISSGQALVGASIMAVFVLGSAPLFLGLGYLTTKLGDQFKVRFFKIAGVLVLYLGITSFNSALALANSPVTLQTIIDNSPISIDLSGSEESASSVAVKGGIQTVNIVVYPTGYSPNYIQVRSGIPVKLNLSTGGGFGCTSTFVIPQLNVRKNLLKEKNPTVEFTPAQPGKIRWTCSMGMYWGTIDVI